MTTYNSIDEANEAIAQKIISAQPTLVDVVAAQTVIPELEDKLILHAGPPIAFEDMPDPVQGAAIGAALFEGWASDEESARRVCSEEVRFAPNNDFRAVGAMGGILSGNLPVFVVENRTDGNRSYTTMHEGEGKVLRFGVYDESVGEHLRWMRDVLGVALSRALKLLPGGGLAVNPILAQAVAMGDEFHVRNTAASSLVAPRSSSTYSTTPSSGRRGDRRRDPRATARGTRPRQQLCSRWGRARHARSDDGRTPRGPRAAARCRGPTTRGTGGIDLRQPAPVRGR